MSVSTKTEATQWLRIWFCLTLESQHLSTLIKYSKAAVHSNVLQSPPVFGRRNCCSACIMPGSNLWTLFIGEMLFFYYSLWVFSCFFSSHLRKGRKNEYWAHSFFTVPLTFSQSTNGRYFTFFFSSWVGKKFLYFFSTKSIDLLKFKSQSSS